MGKGAITCDTDDYGSPVEIPPESRIAVGAKYRAVVSDSSDSEGSLFDSTSDSDDSSSESDLEIRGVQRKAYRRRRALERGKPLKAHRRN